MTRNFSMKVIAVDVDMKSYFIRTDNYRCCPFFRIIVVTEIFLKSQASFNI